MAIGMCSRHADTRARRRGVEKMIGCSRGFKGEVLLSAAGPKILSPVAASEPFEVSFSRRGRVATAS
jgi:hypothetical protein